MRLVETPGRESQLWQQVDQYRADGYTISEIEGSGGWPKLKTYWACPPGKMPKESQTQMLRAEF